MPDRMIRGHNPDTITWFTIMCVVSAVLTVAGETPGSVQELVPFWLGMVWSAWFSVSCGLVVAGVLCRDHLLGWRLEVSGRVGAVFTAAAYTVALADAMQWWGTALVLSMIAGIGVSSAWRLFDLGRHFAEFKTWVGAVRRVQRGR